MYRSWDMYSAWRGKKAHRNRLYAGWVILMILPVTQFAILFTLVGLFNVSLDPTVAGVIRIILISIAPFFTFGYFRIYEALIHRSPEKFFSEEERGEGRMEIRSHIPAHIIPGILYVAISTLMLVLSLYV